jgi:hypothetical protein
MNNRMMLKAGSKAVIEDGDQLQLNYLTDERKARCTYALLTTGVSLADHGRPRVHPLRQATVNTS